MRLQASEGVVQLCGSAVLGRDPRRVERDLVGPGLDVRLGPNDIAARVPRTFILAQSAIVLPYGDGGHSRFFSSSSSRVAST